MGDIVQGLAAYLEELDGYRVVCLRHSEAVAVLAQQGGIWVFRRFESNPSLLAHLEATVPLLPPRPRELRAEPVLPARSLRPDLRPVISHTGIQETRHIAVEVRVSSESPTPRQVEVGLHLSESDVPELPLRMLATALRCHEFLIPADFAPALRLPSQEIEGRHTIHQYLERNTPRTMIAGQCI